MAAHSEFFYSLVRLKMRGRWRDIHRAEIRRQLYRRVDKRWDSLYGLYCAAIVFVGFGFSGIVEAKLRAFGAILFITGAALLWLYSSGVRSYSQGRALPAWFSLRDHVAIAVAWLALTLVESLNVRYVAAAAIGAVATVRMRKLWNPHWRVLFFYEARAYFRELAKWQPNQRFKPTRLPPRGLS